MTEKHLTTLTAVGYEANVSTSTTPEGVGIYYFLYKISHPTQHEVIRKIEGGGEMRVIIKKIEISDFAMLVKKSDDNKDERQAFLAFQRQELAFFSIRQKDYINNSELKYAEQYCGVIKFTLINEGRHKLTNIALCDDWNEVPKFFNKIELDEKYAALTQQYDATVAGLVDLADQHEISTDQEFRELYPIFKGGIRPINSAPNSGKVSMAELLLSRTYSKDPEKTSQFFKKAINSFYQNEFSAEVINYLGLTIAQGPAFPVLKSEITPFSNTFITVQTTSAPLRLIDALSDISSVNFDKVHGDDDGHYHFKLNVAAINSHSRLDLLHELTHAAMSVLFENRANPFPEKAIKEPNQIEQEYLEAKDKVFMHISARLGDFLGEDFYNNPESVSQFLGLKTEEKIVFHDLLTPFYEESYSAAEVNAEVIARAIPLLMQGLNPNGILMPIQDWWHKHISTTIEEMEHHHQDWCDSGQNLMGNQSFQFCITDITGN